MPVSGLGLHLIFVELMVILYLQNRNFEPVYIKILYASGRIGWPL